jgi:FG-GAP repeat protein
MTGRITVRQKTLATLTLFMLSALSATAQADPVVIAPAQQILQTNELDCSVAVHGNRIVVGCPHNVGSAPPPGTVYVFERRTPTCTGSTCWVLAEQFNRPDAFSGDFFGTSVAYDGENLAVGSTSSIASTAAVYIYRRQGGHFVFAQKLTGDPPNQPADEPSAFGALVVLDHGRLAVNELPIFTTGTAYVFAQDGHGIWHREARLDPAHVKPGDQYGVSVALDGDTAVVGADNGSYATVFERHGSQWRERQTLLPSDAPAGGGPTFGRSVSIHGDRIAVGAYIATDPALPDPSMAPTGAVYVFKRDGRDWTPEARVTPAAQPFYSNFGMQTVLRAGRFAAASGNGVYVFEHEHRQWNDAALLVTPDGAISIGNSLDSLDWRGHTLVTTSMTGVWTFEVPRRAD